MSKNKDVKTNVYKKPSKSEIKKAKAKKVIIIAVIAVVAVAVAIGAAFLIKKHIEKKTFEKINSAVTHEYETVGSAQSGDFVNVSYNGTTMPEEFARILNQAAVDSENACKSVGVAVDLSGKQISTPEFRMYYYETAYNKYREALSLEEQRGSNVSGFDYYSDPASQRYLQEEITWEDHFVNETVEVMKVYYNEFERACRSNTQFSDEEAAEILEILAQVKNEDFVSNYGEGATYEMYCAKYIRQIYSDKFYNDEQKRIADGYSEDAVAEEYGKSAEKYQVVNARIYAIEGGYDSSEMGEIKTEEEFLEYAEKNYRKIAGDIELDIDLKTYNWCVSYDTVDNRYGGEVANWLFDDARKPGDIALLEGAAYKCLVYVEETKYETFSSDIIYIEIPYNDLSSAEEQKQAVEKAYDEWKKGGATAETLKAAFENMGTVEELTARAGVFEQQADRWIHKEPRKSGDSTVFYTDAGAYVFFYVSQNKDDYDWKDVIRNELAVAEYRKNQETLVAENFPDVKKNTAVIEAAADAVNKQCSEFVEAYKEKS